MSHDRIVGAESESALRAEVEDLRARLDVALARIAELERGAPETAERLRASEARLREVIDLVPHFIFAKDAEGRFLLVNEAVARAFGSTVDEVTGRTDADYVSSPEQVAHFRQDDLAVIESGEPLLIPEETITDAEGETRYLHTLKIPYVQSGSERPAILGVAVDITERKRGEEERLALEARLREARRLESLGLLTGGLAHDFNNVLQVVLGNIDLALDDVDESTPAGACLEQSVIACRRASDMCNQLLAYAGRGRTEPEPIALGPLIDEVCELLAVGLPPGIELRTSVEELPPVLADASQMRQVLLNLITNAAESHEDGSGTIEVTARARHLSADEIAASFQNTEASEGEYVLLEVHDAGRGMSAETRARIFDPFFTTKPSGHGLGLAAVLGIVRTHGGALEVESEPGTGTRVRVLLPAARGAVVKEEAQRLPAVALPGSGTVLVVDDEEGVRRLAERVLERAGFDVVSASSGSRAIEILEEQAGSFCLVLLDLTMPGTQGGEVLHRLREIRSDLPVVITSGFSEPAALAGLSEAEPTVFLQKPFRATDLLEIIDRLLRA